MPNCSPRLPNLFAVALEEFSQVNPAAALVLREHMEAVTCEADARDELFTRAREALDLLNQGRTAEAQYFLALALELE